MPQAQLLAIDFRHQAETIELSLTGEIDVFTATAFHQALTRAMSMQPETLVVDLERVEFLGSDCIHLLARAAQDARDCDVLRFVVLPPLGQARRALDAAGGLSLIVSQPDPVAFREPAVGGPTTAAARFALSERARERGMRRRPARFRRDHETYRA